MSSSRIVSCVAARPALGGALAITTTLLLAGCDASHLSLNTTPDSGSNAATSRAFTAEFSDSLAGAVRAESEGARLGGPLAGLDGGELARFLAGKEEFEEEEEIEDGLGPVFNEASCVACHNAPTGGTNGRLETRFGRWEGLQFDALAHLGGSLIQDHAIGPVRTEHGAYDYVAELVPPEATITALRNTTPLFGLGLVEAVTDAMLIELARFQARNTPLTQGTPHMVTDVGTGALRVGRFGWKAQVATLHTFSGDAYLNEMGFTSPGFPEENAPQGDRDALAYNPFPAMNDDGDGVTKFADFMAFLAPPPRGPRNPHTEAGAEIFQQVGCANCHTPTLVTGDNPVPALANKTFHPFSDFLLHDMGELGDGIVQGQSNGRQMRTAPLWGLSARPLYLHDGRAKKIEDAVLYHAGQGREARDRFRQLGQRERAALLAFLRSL